MAEKMGTRIGGWSFIIGLIIAVIAGVLVPSAGWLIALLGILGLIVGFLNVTAKEATPFLVASIALVVAASGFNAVLATLGTSTVTNAIMTVLGNIAVFVSPAAVLVSIRAIYSLAKEE